MSQKQTKKGSAERDIAFAKGGSGAANKMATPQAAGPAAPARTGKTSTPAPGAKSAKGGPPTPRGASLATPAKPGRTGVVKAR